MSFPFTSNALKTELLKAKKLKFVDPHPGMYYLNANLIYCSFKLIHRSCNCNFEDTNFVRQKNEVCVYCGGRTAVAAQPQDFGSRSESLSGEDVPDKHDLMPIRLVMKQKRNILLYIFRHYISSMLLYSIV
jgi:hypothetical protein